MGLPMILANMLSIHWLDVYTQVSARIILGCSFKLSGNIFMKVLSCVIYIGNSVGSLVHFEKFLFGSSLLNQMIN